MRRPLVRYFIIKAVERFNSLSVVVRVMVAIVMAPSFSRRQIWNIECKEVGLAQESHSAIGRRTASFCFSHGGIGFGSGSSRFSTGEEGVLDLEALLASL
jgi:hypothetical protein